MGYSWNINVFKFLECGIYSWIISLEYSKKGKSGQGEVKFDQKILSKKNRPRLQFQGHLSTFQGTNRAESCPFKS